MRHKLIYKQMIKRTELKIKRLYVKEQVVVHRCEDGDSETKTKVAQGFSCATLSLFLFLAFDSHACLLLALIHSAAAYLRYSFGILASSKLHTHTHTRTCTHIGSLKHNTIVEHARIWSAPTHHLL